MKFITRHPDWLTVEEMRRIAELRSQGVTYAELCAMMWMTEGGSQRNVKDSTISDAVNKYGAEFGIKTRNKFESVLAPKKNLSRVFTKRELSVDEIRKLRWVCVHGAGKLGMVVIRLLREHNVEVCVCEPGSGEKYRNDVKVFKRLRVDYYFNGKSPDRHNFDAHVRCDGSVAEEGVRVTPSQLAEAWPECPFAARVRDVLENQT